MTTLSEVIILVVGLTIVLSGVYYFAPGLRVSASKALNGLDLNSDKLDNVTKGEKLPLPSKTVSSKVGGKGLIRIAEYAWNGNSGMVVANGGPRTTEGSLMEHAGINLEIVRQDAFKDLRNMQIAFIDEYANGKEYPINQKSAFAVSIMGDGLPFYLTSAQKSIDDKFGKDKYHLQAIAPIGLSYGEDKLIGPKIWKDNPQTMKGSVISAVIGDGDYILVLNHAFANKIPVNPDPKTYDANAINFYPAEDDDYIKAAKVFVSSQLNDFKVELNEVKDGKLTGKKIKHKIDGTTTWTPGDKIVFDALSGFTDIVSTKEYMNQMATTIVVVKEWALNHEKEIVGMLTATYTANNQIKQYDEWAVRASECVALAYNAETPKYWYNMFKGQKSTKDGLDYNIGGTRVFNFSDAKMYYGLSDNINRYKNVYDQISLYLTELNVMDFNSEFKNGAISYNDAVNTYFIARITDIDNGNVEKQDYTDEKTNILAKGNWSINFETGSANINGSTKELEEIYNLLITAEQTKLNVIGHTDATGNYNSNMLLSKDRANSVVNYLLDKGIPKERFQLVDGKGNSEPISKDYSKNRRVVITLLN